MAGGALPLGLAGTHSSVLMSIADWYRTFLFLATGSPDVPPDPPEVPPLDSVNMWHALLVANGRAADSARRRLVLAVGHPGPGGGDRGANDSAMIVWPYKVPMRCRRTSIRCSAVDAL
jgi:hypothetical protein